MPKQTWWRLVGCGGALVETMTFNRRVVGSNPALAATWGPWASPLPAVACALWHETPIQYPCCRREQWMFYTNEATFFTMSHKMCEQSETMKLLLNDTK